MFRYSDRRKELCTGLKDWRTEKNCKGVTPLHGMRTIPCKDPPAKRRESFYEKELETMDRGAAHCRDAGHHAAHGGLCRSWRPAGHERCAAHRPAGCAGGGLRRRRRGVSGHFEAVWPDRRGRQHRHRREDHHGRAGIHPG